MPPKPRFTREEIVAAALDIVSRKGIEALTARELGETLGSSISCSSCAKTAAPSALTMCSEEQLGRMLSTEFQAMMLLVKSGGQS